ncbi:hypothetical protein BJF85_12230 [Saccharomonospora sp. CUA-673]|uniref:WXG100 family type VII secretion target n=1 Tax=Saccharomonospora sp. CUA-673 TaxID=1904969 RepID=UPI000962440B|nr:hypothetical protein [Saccharomonospora sp. CUA-673]OLT48565.1 hypothetical protein BJF85_12230 [Saccharomonospora sp. CUA-673]
MSLNIEVEAKPDSMRSLARWLRRTGRAVSNRHDDVTKASERSEDGWEGGGARAFRRSMGSLTPKIDELSGGYGGLANAIDLHAADIDTTKARMEQAVEIAREGGLTVTDKEIKEPGEPPAKPDPPHRHPKSGAVSGADKERFDAQWEVYGAWMKKAKAYAEAGVVVTEARKIETDSQNLLLDYLENVGEKWYINVPDFGTGLAAAHIAAHNSFKTHASHFRQLGSHLGELAGDMKHGAQTQARYMMTGLMATSRANVHAAQANSRKFGRWLNGLPKPVRGALTANLGRYIPANAKYLSGAKPLLSKLPVLGTALGGGSMIADLASGKDPTVTVLSTGGSIVAGAAAGGAVGGVPGAVVGFVAATGTGFLIENAASDDVKAAIEVASETDDVGGLGFDLSRFSRFVTGNW